jgi:hypothetical protein
LQKHGIEFSRHLTMQRSPRACVDCKYICRVYRISVSGISWKILEQEEYRTRKPGY